MDYDVLKGGLYLALKFHNKQVKKANVVENVPYVSHLLEVSGIVLESGGSYEDAAAALLHDAIEDGTLDLFFIENGSIEDIKTIIRNVVGNSVLEKVISVTELSKNGNSWYERKREYLSRIKNYGASELLISLADKLQQAKSLRRNVIMNGDTVYYNFAKSFPENQRKNFLLRFFSDLCIEYDMRLEILEKEKDLPILKGIKALLIEFVEIVDFLMVFQRKSS